MTAARPAWQALVVAGGAGLRMGAPLPKQFLPLAGRPILMRSLEAFAQHWPRMPLALVLPEGHFDYWRQLCEQHQFALPHRLLPGGAERFHSVRNGLEAIGPGLVAIHDGVRPLVSRATIEAAFELAGRHGAAIPVLPAVESLRQVSADGGSRAVARAEFRLVQSPQVFAAQALKRAYERPYSPLFTDDASVFEAAGHAVHLCPGNPENIKITTASDLVVAEALWNSLRP